MQGIVIVIMIVLRITIWMIEITARIIFWSVRGIFRLCRKVYRRLTRPKPKDIKQITIDELIKNTEK